MSKINLSNSQKINKSSASKTLHSFLRLLYGDEPPGWLTLWTRQEKKTAWFKAANQRDQAIKEASKLAKSQDVYFGVGLRRSNLGPDQRGKVKHVIAIPGFWVDIDIQHPVHKRKDLPVTLEDASKILKGFSLPPTIIIASGYGLQAYWLLRTLWTLSSQADRQEATVLLQRFQGTMRAVAGQFGWGLDSTGDLTRVLRLPGTINRKAVPVPVRLLEVHPKRRYDLADFAPHLTDLETKTIPTQRVVALPEDLPDVDVASLLISDRIKDVIRTGEDVDTPQRYASRSEAVYAVVRALVSAKYSDDTIASVLLDVRNGISPKPREQGKKWVMDEIARARRKPSKPSVEAVAPADSLPPPTVHAVASFPVEVFPAPLARLIREVADALSCPMDLVGVPMLAVLGTAIGTSRSVHIKPDWVERACIFSGVVADPGTKKSPALERIIAPLEAFQQTCKVLYEEKRKAFEKMMTRYELKLWAWKATAKNKGENKRGKVGHPPKPPTPPVMKQLYTTDATVEALATLLRDNPRGLLFFRDELTGWVRSMDQYRNGKGADRQVWLSLWSGGSIVINRKTSREPILLSRPFICVTGSLPPDMLRELCDRQGREDGFLHRLLLAFPEPIPLRVPEAGLSPQVLWGYQGVIEQLLLLRPGQDEAGQRIPEILSLNREASARFKQWETAHYCEMEMESFPRYLRGPWAKMVGYCARLSLILQLCHNAVGLEPSTFVQEPSMTGAIGLIEYFKSHARKVYATLRQTEMDKRVEAASQWLRRHGGECTPRDLQKAGVAGIKRASEARALLRELEDRGLGQITKVPARRRGNSVERFRLAESASNRIG